MEEMQGARIHISGIVQGVGFRPFIYNLAKGLALRGWVKNTSAGVDIEVDGTRAALESFLRRLESEHPPLAVIEEVKVERREPDGFTDFDIIPSEALPGEFQPISPDVSLCRDCRRELFDPRDRRFRYPFINCTNCGPRFTIIRDVPYDRSQTTMAGFRMCPECEQEYHDPTDRRYHAQPVACPECGPQVWLEQGSTVTAREDEALSRARILLSQGKILAVKGLGGFHLACDATNREAVVELRKRKLRVDKPFALMGTDLKAIGRRAELNPSERELLLSRERPIVILTRATGSDIALEAAPNQHTLGFMLPYTPLHELLMEPESGFPEVLVMTSGNLSEEPIAISNAEARRRLSQLADAFLLHDRDIQTRSDDSVTQVFEGLPYPLRRARGYAPFPIRLGKEVPQVLACGAELKNTFCLTKGRYAFLSQHIGDMQNYETLQSFEEGIRHFERLFRIEPEVIAYDLHPGYMATEYGMARAERESLPMVGVQHHHAHILSCMAEHGLETERSVIGLSYDGTGYGLDGAIWGGEAFLVDDRGVEFRHHLEYFPLPGGDAAIRQPWRVALTLCSHAGIGWDPDLPPVRAASEEERRILQGQLAAGINAPQTSSMGRLFDGIASLMGIRHCINYEAQAAVEMESLVVPEEKGAYPMPLEGERVLLTPLIQAVHADLQAQESVGRMAARFHNGLASLSLNLALRLAEISGVKVVVLSGGVWQNMILLQSTVEALHRHNFHIFIHRTAPANDGGLALGQAIVAARKVLDEQIEEWPCA